MSWRKSFNSNNYWKINIIKRYEKKRLRQWKKMQLSLSLSFFEYEKKKREGSERGEWRWLLFINVNLHAFFLCAKEKNRCSFFKCENRVEQFFLFHSREFWSIQIGQSERERGEKLVKPVPSPSPTQTNEHNTSWMRGRNQPAFHSSSNNCITGDKERERERDPHLGIPFSPSFSSSSHWLVRETTLKSRLVLGNSSLLRKQIQDTIHVECESTFQPVNNRIVSTHRHFICRFVHPTFQDLLPFQDKKLKDHYHRLLWYIRRW